MELMGSTITQISCGRRHTLAFVPSRGRVYSFGLGGSGQLGNRASNNFPTPQVVMGPWVSPSGSKLVDDHVDMVIRRIFCGGDHCFAFLVDLQNDVIPDDCRYYE